MQVFQDGSVDMKMLALRVRRILSCAVPFVTIVRIRYMVVRPALVHLPIIPAIV